AEALRPVPGRHPPPAQGEERQGVVAEVAGLGDGVARQVVEQLHQHAAGGQLLPRLRRPAQGPAVQPQARQAHQPAQDHHRPHPPPPPPRPTPAPPPPRPPPPPPPPLRPELGRHQDRPRRQHRQEEQRAHLRQSPHLRRPQLVAQGRPQRRRQGGEQHRQRH